MTEELEIPDRKHGQPFPEAVKKALMKEIEDLLFTKGYSWNKSELARKYKTNPDRIRILINEMNDAVRHIDYEAMQVLRLEKQRQLLLEELNDLRSKKKPRSHILKELRETERAIAEERRKSGMADNKEVINIKSESKGEMSIIDIGRILETEIQKKQNENGTG